MSLQLNTFISNGQVNGRILDIETNYPVAGATVTSGANKVITNENGQFSIKIDGWVLISHPSYKSDSVSIGAHDSYATLFLVPENIKIKEVLVRGPLQQSLLINLPASVSLLRKKELNQDGSISYLEKLNQLPGVYVHTGTLNTNRITIRGIGSRTPYGTNRVKAYYNDIPLTSADGSTNIEDIDNDIINAVDILKGPKSAVYGSGLGGIILLEDKDYVPQGFHGEVSVQAGELETYKPMVSLHYKKGNFTLNSFYSNTQTAGSRENSAYNRHSFQLKLVKRGSNSKSELLLHYIDLKSFIPSSLNEETFRNNPEKAAANWLAIKGFEEYTKLVAGFRNQFTINKKLSSKTIVYAYLSDAYESRPFNILDDLNQRLGFKSYLNYSPGAWQMQAGFELVDEQYKWDIFETIAGMQGAMQNSYSEKRNSAVFFADLKWHFKNRWTIESGISYNFQNYELSDLLPDSINQSGSYRYKNIPAPFLGINVPIFRNNRIYGSYSYGFSYPTVEETLLPDGEINNKLKPETGNNFELGIRVNAFDNNLFIDVCTYLILVDNLLVTERISEDVFTGKNAGSTIHSGFELTTVTLFNKKEYYHLPSVKFNLGLSISKNTFKDFINNSISYNGNTLPGVPNFNFSSSFEFNYSSGIYFNIKNQYTGKQYLDDGNTGSYSSYHLVYLKAGYKKKMKGYQSIAFYVGINNAFDEKYASMILVNAPSFGAAAPRYYYPGKPRYYFGGISLTF